MKSKIVILFFFTSIYFTFSQQEPNYNKAIGTSCFFAGSSTKIVKEYEDLLKKNDIKSVKKQLFSNDAEEQLLSVLVVEALKSVNRIQISEEEKMQIQKIKKSDIEVFTCSGCTLFQKISLKNFFASTIPATQIQANIWLENYINGYKNRLSRL